MNPYFETDKGVLYLGDCLKVMPFLPPESIDLVVTSPPYSDIKQGYITKDYHNIDNDKFVDWLVEVCKQICRLLKPTGSFILNLGGRYNKDATRSLVVYESVISICKNTNLKLLQDCFWVKKTPFPSSYATKYMRFRDAIEYLFWFGKNPKEVKTKLENVCLKPTEITVRTFIRKFKTYGDKDIKVPSGHIINFARAMKVLEVGSTPLNYIYVGNTSSNSSYLKFCRERNLSHPARFPKQLPEYFILALTEENDTVLDPFFGSGTTAFVAEEYNRKWIGIEISEPFCRVFADYHKTIKGGKKDDVQTVLV